MANRSSTIALNIQANTQKALNQFKSFSSDIQNKFLISGLQLDFVRNALSSINREFERYAGGGGLSDAIQTQQLTRSLQTSLSTVQGYSVQVGKALSENIGLALSKINAQVGGNKDEISAFTTNISTAINEQVALGLTGTKNLVTANEQVYGLMQRLKLGYGTSIEEQSEMFKKVLLNEMSMDELLNNVSGPLQNLFRTAAFQSGGQPGNMAGVNRGAFLKKVEELSGQFLPSIEELTQTNPQAIIGRLMNTLFDDRIGIFGALRQIKLPTGGTTTLLKEGAELLNALFGDKGLFITLVKEIGRAFGVKTADDAALVIVNLIDFFTEIANKLTTALQTPEMRANLKKVADVIKGFGAFIKDIIDSLLGTGKLGDKQIDQLASATAKALELFAEVLSRALVQLSPKIGNAIWVAIQGLTKGMIDFVFSGNPLGAALGMAGAGFAGIKLFQGGKELEAIRQEEIKKLNNQVRQNNQDIKFFSKQEMLRNEQLNQLRKEITLKQNQIAAGGDSAVLSKEINKLKKQESTLQVQSNLASSQKAKLTTMNATAEGSLLKLKSQSSRLEMMGIALKSRMTSMLMRGLGAGLLGGALEAGSSMAMGESWQRALIKGGINVLGSGAGFALGGPMGALIGGSLASYFAGNAADALGFNKYNGNFPTAANGIFNAMNKESQMSGNKGLVIANQDEIIAPPHRLAQLAGMVSNMSGSGKAQYALNDNFKKYQDEQKKQMRDLIKEVQIGNNIKVRKETSSQGSSTQTVNNNNVTNQIDGKSFAEGAPKSLWDNISSSFMSLGDRLKQAIGIRASGNLPTNFFQAYKSEMNAYGGNPVLANDKELIVSPRNYSTFASLLRSVSSGGGGASIQNEININVASNGEIDTNKIANAVMKAIDTKYAETYRSLSYV